jgi:hypothetical protein
MRIVQTASLPMTKGSAAAVVSESRNRPSILNLNVLANLADAIASWQVRTIWLRCWMVAPVTAEASTRRGAALRRQVGTTLTL